MKKTIILLTMLLVFVAMLCSCECKHKECSEASCTAASICVKCGAEVSPALGHKNGEWITDEDPTCIADGSKHQSCTVCNETLKTEAIKKLGHTAGQWIVDKEANCTENGRKHKECTVCGTTVQTETLSKLGHKGGAWITDKEATCTDSGEKHQECTVCYETIKSETITALGHSYGNWQIVKEATCRDAGERHAYCSRCNDKKSETIAVSSTHSYDAGVVTKQPTCTATGSKAFTCTVCGKTRVESISALGHTLDSSNKCKVCGLVSLNMTSAEIAKSKEVTQMSYSVYEYSYEIQIYITLKEKNGYTREAPAYVDVIIEGEDGSILYSETIIKKSSQDSVTIDYDDVIASYSEIGTLRYRVYNDYFSFDEMSKELEQIPWTIDVELPELPKSITYSAYRVYSVCSITEITYEVSGDDLYFYFTGEKTYDSHGENYSDSCKVGWKLYDEDGYVVATGTIYTEALATGERFRNEKAYAWDCVEQGKKYRLEIMNVG